MGPEQTFLSHLAQGRFMLQRSRTTGTFFFHPRVAEPVTGSTDVEWVQASGLGTVYATTVTRPRAPAAPFNVALVELQEGPRMLSRVEGAAPEEVRIGMPVRARIARHGDAHVVVFDLATETGHA